MNYLVAAKNALKHGTKFIVKHSPTILTIFGVGMMGGATVVAIVETPKANSEFVLLECDDAITHNEYLKKKARIIFYHYWLTATLSLGGAAMIFWSHHVTLGQTAAAIAAYRMKTEDLEKLEAKIAQTDGEKHLEKMKTEMMKDTIGANPPDDASIIDTGKGKMLCYEVVSGRYFYSDIEKIRKANNDLNEQIADAKQYGDEPDISINEWYDYLGLERTRTGNKLGWHNQLIRLNFTSLLTTDGTPCLCVGYKDPPVWEFDSYISDRGISSDDWCDRAPNVL